MKGSSKVIIGATLVMVVILAIILGLIVVLLAELYGSLLLRRRKLRITTSKTAGGGGNAVAIDSSSQPPPLQDQSAVSQPLRSFYAHGVLRAPRSFLFPSVHGEEDKVDMDEKQRSHLLHQLFQSDTQPLPSATPHRIGVVSNSPHSPNSFLISVSCSPKYTEKVPVHGGGSDSGGGDGGGGDGEHFVYISNPIYDNDAGRPTSGIGTDTPFETPDTSPSRLETGGSSGDMSKMEQYSPSSSCSSSLPNLTPPLTPMKKLPAEACSVSLRDGRSLATSGSDSNSNNDVSSSSSGSPCTSPSW
ncbi:hypothetical protein U1Q18_018189 [Sarracenia purpurea var. burkii]